MQRTINEAAAALGRKGGQSKSRAKQAAARINGKLGGRFRSRVKLQERKPKSDDVQMR